MDKPKTLLDWKAEHARDLEVMRANTRRWQRKGIIATPEDVRIRAAKKLTNPSKRVNSTGRPALRKKERV